MHVKNLKRGLTLPNSAMAVRFRMSRRIHPGSFCCTTHSVQQLSATEIMWMHDEYVPLKRRFTYVITSHGARP